LSLYYPKAIRSPVSAAHAPCGALRAGSPATEHKGGLSDPVAEAVSEAAG